MPTTMSMASARGGRSISTRTVQNVGDPLGHPRYGRLTGNFSPCCNGLARTFDVAFGALAMYTVSGNEAAVGETFIPTVTAGHQQATLVTTSVDGLIRTAYAVPVGTLGTIDPYADSRFRDATTAAVATLLRTFRPFTIVGIVQAHPLATTSHSCMASMGAPSVPASVYRGLAGATQRVTHIGRRVPSFTAVTTGSRVFIVLPGNDIQARLRFEIHTLNIKKGIT